MGQSNVLTLGAGLDEIARAVTASMTSYRIEGRSARFQTPFLAPGGSPISVVVHPDDDSGWMIHDDGFGALEAEMSSALSIYRNVARSVAEREGLHFDQRMIFCTSVPIEWVPNAVTILAGAVRSALIRTAERQALAVHDNSHHLLVEKLERHFGAQKIVKNAEISGAAGNSWHVDALVTLSNRWRGVFEIVAPHPNSIASSFTKLSDIGATEAPPSLIAVKQPHARFQAPHLTLISRAANAVVDMDRPIADWISHAA